MTQMQIDFLLRFLELQVKATGAVFLIGVFIFFASNYFTKIKNDE